MHTHRASRCLISATLPLLLATSLSACGSSKPAYCSDLGNLKKSVQSLASTDVLKGGVSSVSAAVDEVKSNVDAVAGSAKADFPTETNAVTSSVDAVAASLKQLSSSPSPAALATLAGEASAAVSALKNFEAATKAKCG